MNGVAPRVLLVEDHVVNEEVLVLLLRRMGCDVEVARDGVEAVERAHEVWDLILMDCGLPRLDGFEATRAIRKLDPAHASVPIVAVTAYAAAADEARCVEAGMNGWLPKPIDASELATVLELHVGWPARERLAGGRDVLDRDVVRHLAELGEPDDPGFFARLVESFRASGAQAVSNLRAHVDAADVPAFQTVVHRLRSSASTIGAVLLRRLCDELESASAPWPPDPVPRIAEEVARACAALDEAVARRAEFRGGA